MIDDVLPAGFAAAEMFGDADDLDLLAAEQRAMAGASGSRRRQYAAARQCARQALAELGVAPVAILNDEERAPLWPAGIVGSMTHCRGYVAAAVASNGALAGVGIDAEPDAELPGPVRQRICSTQELDHLAGLGRDTPSWDRVLWSAKESVYKAWFPLTRRWLGHRDAAVRIDPVAGTFTARIRPDLPGGDHGLGVLTGRWASAHGLIVTAVLIDADHLADPGSSVG